MRKARIMEVMKYLGPLCDMHCHILPGMDDGPGEMEESVKMAVAAWEQGISHIIATPHLDMEQADLALFVNRREERLEALRRELSATGVPIRLSGGAEVALAADLPGCIQAMGVGHFVAAAGLAGTSRVLVEFSCYGEPVWAEETLFRLMLLGLEPVIAHPERCPWLVRDLERLESLVQRGCRLQLNAESLLPGGNRKTSDTTDRMIRDGLVRLVGSDAHSNGLRRCRLREALAAVARRFGPETAARLAENGRKDFCETESVKV